MTPNLLTPDPILDEIHQTRERIVQKFAGNSAAILEDARKRQAESGRKIWVPTKSEEKLVPVDSIPPQ